MISTLVFGGMMSLHAYYHIICKIIFIACWWMLILFLNVNSWISYFNTKWTYYTLQLEWEKIINSKYSEITQQSNWYIVNNNRYGNLTFIFILFSVIHFCGFIFQLLSEILFGHNPDNNNMYNHPIITTTSNQYFIFLHIVLTIIIQIPFILFYIIIVCKTKSIKDIFYVYWENQIKSKFIVSLITVYISINLLNYFTDNVQICTLVMVPLVILILFGMSYVSTFGIMNKNKSNFYTERGLYGGRSTTAMCKEDHIAVELKLAKLRKRVCKINSSQITMEQILSSKKPLNLFMNHISKEYSTECLLSYIEFSQFQQYLLQQMRHECEYLDKPIILYDTPSDIPMSHIIVHDDDDNDEIINCAKMKARKLYNKYIKFEADYEINIAGTLRHELEEKLSDKQKLLNNKDIGLKDLVKLFEKPRTEMLMLLNYSLARFKQTIDYGEILTFFGQKSNNIPNTPITTTISIGSNDRINEIRTPIPDDTPTAVANNNTQVVHYA